MISGTSINECASFKSTCTYTSGKTCRANCAAASGPFDLSYCMNFDVDCGVKLDATGCVNLVSTCEVTDATNCTKSK